MVSSDDVERSLQPTTTDYVAAGARAVLGMVPIVGSVLVEVVDVTIPRQRIDCIVKFAECLSERVSDLEGDFVRAQLSNENFAGLLEEALQQAAKSVTEERREYIASLVAESLTDEAITYNESKHLLRILGEINDIEVIWLRYYAVPNVNGDKPFRERHASILAPVSAPANAPQETHHRAALQESYKEHLSRLGLLEPTYQTDLETRTPRFDSFTGGMRVRGYRMTVFGSLLLRHIGLEPDWEDS
jgi:hypothetical protein